MDRITCPNCGGQKISSGLVMRNGVCSEDTIPCTLCQGEGTMPGEYLERLARGRELREERLVLGHSLNEAAHLIGINPAQLSAMEHGSALICLKSKTYRHWYSACEECGLYCFECGELWPKERNLSEADFTVAIYTAIEHTALTGQAHALKGTPQ